MAGIMKTLVMFYLLETVKRNIRKTLDDIADRKFTENFHDDFRLLVSSIGHLDEVTDKLVSLTENLQEFDESLYKKLAEYEEMDGTDDVIDKWLEEIKNDNENEENENE